MVCLICDEHGSTTFVTFVCNELYDDYQCGRRLRDHRKITVTFDPPIEGIPDWFSMLFCDQCQSDIGISDLTQLTDKELETTFSAHKERFYQPKIICNQCLADHQTSTASA